MDDFTARIEHVESLLYDLALHLRRVPLAPATTKLHVGALDLKRRLIAWRGARPDEVEWKVLMIELELLAREVAALLPALPSKPRRG